MKHRPGSSFVLRRGFSLVELMVAISVVAILTSIVVIQFRSGQYRDELRGGAQFVARYLERAQTEALAGKAYDFGSGIPTVSPGGYGVKIDIGSNTLLYAADGVGASNPLDCWLNGTSSLSKGAIELTNWASLFPNLNMAQLCTTDPTSGGVTCVSQAQGGLVHFIYEVPNGDRCMNGVMSPLNSGQFTLRLQHSKLTGQYIEVTANAVTGQVTVTQILNS